MKAWDFDPMPFSPALSLKRETKTSASDFPPIASFAAIVCMKPFRPMFGSRPEWSFSLLNSEASYSFGRWRSYGFFIYLAASS